MKKNSTKKTTKKTYVYVAKGVYMLPSGTYRARFTKNGIVTSKYFTNKAEAIKYYNKNTK